MSKSIIWLRFLFVILIILGIFFRFVNLGQKVYWYDEVITSIRISGHTKAELVPIIARKIWTFDDLQEYQQVNPDKSIIDTIKSLILEDPKHAPLYYATVRFWTQFFGDSIVATRSLSALISVIAFPCIYWLCLELFESSLIGWTAIALLAVSPFYVLYAQEARQYSLWTVTTLLSSATLLRAMRINTTLTWRMYALTLALSFYTSTLSALIAVTHGIYVLINKGFRTKKIFIYYVLASLLAILTFLPWGLFIVRKSSVYNLGWTAKYLGHLHLVKMWFLNLMRIFWDFPVGNNPYELNLTYQNPLLYLVILIVVLIGYSLLWICYKTPKPIWSFVLLLIGIPTIPILLEDILSQELKSTIPRYLIPSYLGIQLAVAYLITTKATSIISSFRKRFFWKVIATILISGGVLSCGIISQSEVWWNKYSNYSDPQIVKIINEYPQPLVISHNSVRLIGLSYLCNSGAKYQLLTEPKKPKLTKDFSHIFLLSYEENTSEIWLANIEKDVNFKTELVYDKSVGFIDAKLKLWHITPNL